MRCARCSAVLEPGQDVCARCGAGRDAAPGGVPLVVGSYGIPVERLAPSAQGPLAAPEPHIAAAHVRARRLRGYRVVQPMPVRRPARHRWLRVFAAIVALAVIVAGGILAGEALGRMRQTAAPGAGTTAPAATMTSFPGACAVPDARESTALTRVQFARGVRDAARGDLRPVQVTDTFTAGQTVHLTFQIATQQAGTASARFCLNGRSTNAAVSVPARSSGRYGQFTLTTMRSDQGSGTATILWDGKVVTAARFTVTP